MRKCAEVAKDATWLLISLVEHSKVRTRNDGEDMVLSRKAEADKLGDSVWQKG